jgi:hypothetical protein
VKKINEDDLSVLTFHALTAARNAFEEYLEKDGNEPAYWDIRFTAWTVDEGFSHRIERIEIEREVKEGEREK